MKAQELLRAQFKQVRQLMEMTIADCSQETLDKKADEWAINSIGALYAHAAMAEDSLVNGIVRGTQPLLERDGWTEKLGVSDATPFSLGKKVDLPAMREFAAAVAKETDEFLANASEDELMKEVKTFGGQTGQLVPAITFLANIVSTHTAGHWGEIAALKGVQGLKGLPY